jgi:serine/threonine protein kinase
MDQSRSINEEDKNDNNELIEKININDFEIGEKLFKSNFGYMALCKRIKSKKIYTMKILKKKKLLSEKFVERQYNEYKILSSIYHPFIIELNGINNTDPINLYYVYQLIGGQSLKYFLKINNRLSLNAAKFYSACVLTALDYLHKKKIILRDIRADNVYINSDGYIKLTEFTFSKKLKTDYTYSTCGFPEYNPPEMINKLGHNKSVDFWQLGILLYEMLIGYPPFIDSDPTKLYSKINKGKIHFPKGFNNNAKMIIKQFLKVDPKRRLGCTERGIYDIIKQPFFVDFDWEALLHRKIDPPIIPKMPKFTSCKSKTIEEDDINEAIPKENDPFYNWN